MTITEQHTLGLFGLQRPRCHLLHSELNRLISVVVTILTDGRVLPAGLCCAVR
jgi:hypothetical protein